MKYVVTIPTQRERGAEINRCISSIPKDPTYPNIPIIIYGQTNDPTIPSMFVDTNLVGKRTPEEYHNLYYVGPDNLNRMLKFLYKNLNLENLGSFFNYRTYGGARNVLTAFAILLMKDIENLGVISIDDDEEVLPGFFGEHLEWLGKNIPESKKTITLVTGPYEGHSSYVGIETLIRLLKRVYPEDIAKDALLSMVPVQQTEQAKKYVYGIKGSRGGNLSRCGSCLLIPYISSREDIPMRGEDEIQACLNLTNTTTNLYTPNARVRHQKRPGYLLVDIKGEIIGSVVHEYIEKYPNYEEIDEDEIKKLLSFYIQNKRRRLSKAWRTWEYRRNKYEQDLQTKVSELYIELIKLFEAKEFFVKQIRNHLEIYLFGRKNWLSIVENLTNARQEIVDYIFGVSH